ncbi:hypothetical protein ACIQC9_01720 [Brevundimonas sp. NPDC092305]|uniref:hypothetical protein n=1 Tax=Brevundimonas sp. NPDC092305 TaxID=3363957 RepID=UPI003813BD97
MTCETLINEINTLNGELARGQTAMTGRAMDSTRESMRGPAGPSMASTALTVGSGIIGALVPGAGLVLGAVQGVADAATEAAIVAHQAKQERQMSELMTEMTAGTEAMMPLMGRVDHLTDISISKGC